MSKDAEILYTGRYLQMNRLDGWEFASRANAKGVVGVLAVTAKREILLIEQFRPPLGKFVVELPAGLAGDEPYKEHEPLLSAAQRELLEETGHQARKWFSLGDGPSSAGLTDEMITLFLALELLKVRELDHFGTGRERIRLHCVRIPEIPDFLARRQKEGSAIDFKICAALYMAQRHPMMPR